MRNPLPLYVHIILALAFFWHMFSIPLAALTGGYILLSVRYHVIHGVDHHDSSQSIPSVDGDLGGMGFASPFYKRE